MLLVEKVSYLKGLLSGLDIDSNSKEGKLFIAIVDVLDEMALTIADIEDAQGEIEELVDILDQDLGQIEETIYEEEDCEIHDDVKEVLEKDEESQDVLEDTYSEDEEVYEIVCPSCSDKIYINYDMLSNGEMECPNCSEYLEFDFEGTDDNFSDDSISE